MSCCHSLAEIIKEGIDLKRTFYYKNRWKIAELRATGQEKIGLQE
jgi:hypothetical protein